MISIIIPVYNAEKYIERCLLSLFDTKDTQIIAVDDHSTDRTFEILKEYAEKILILRNERNLGTGPSRNRGVFAAKGKYIGFLDNDDWVDFAYFEKMTEIIEKENADICVARRITNHTKKGARGHLLPAKDLREAAFVERTAPWAKIYRRDFLIKNNILFDEGRGEDIRPAFLCAFLAKKIAVSDSKALYHCQIRTNSVSHRAVTIADLAEIEVYGKIFKYLEAACSSSSLFNTGGGQYLYWKKMVKKRGMITFDFLYPHADKGLQQEILKKFEEIFNCRITPAYYFLWKIKRKFQKLCTFLSALF